jgi:hypothetical protein
MLELQLKTKNWKLKTLQRLLTIHRQLFTALIPLYPQKKKVFHLQKLKRDVNMLSWYAPIVHQKPKLPTAVLVLEALKYGADVSVYRASKSGPQTSILTLPAHTV